MNSQESRGHLFFNFGTSPQLWNGWMYVTNDHDKYYQTDNLLMIRGCRLTWTSFQNLPNFETGDAMHFKFKWARKVLSNGWQITAKGNVVRVAWPFLTFRTFGAPFEWVKLGTSNLAHKLIISSARQRVMNYTQRGMVRVLNTTHKGAWSWSRIIFNFSKFQDMAITFNTFQH